MQTMQESQQRRDLVGTEPRQQQLLALQREQLLLSGFSADEVTTLLGFLHRLHDNLRSVREFDGTDAADASSSAVAD